MDRKVVGGEMELTKHGETRLRSGQSAVYEVIRKMLGREVLFIGVIQPPDLLILRRDICIVAGHLSDMLRSPQEIFEENTRCFHKVSVHFGPVETGKLGHGKNVVHSVPDFME